MDSKIIQFAIEAHDKVNHLYDGKPYSVHLAMTAMIALQFIDIVPESQHRNVLNAAWLHDTIEDCRLTYNDIKKAAGEEVAEIVYALTNDKGRTRKDRASSNYYEGILSTPFARYVKLCVRLANVKHSKQTESRMLDVYRKEHSEFIDHLFSNENDRRIYSPLINEIAFYLH